MRVLLTGGTGFVGSHATAALLAAGYEVRLLARSPAKVAPVLAPFGVAEADVEVAKGDVVDGPSIEAAMTGCDAAIHAASMFTLDRRQAETMLRVNVEGAELVLGTARRLGLDPTVYVSSEVSMLPPRGVLTPDSPVGDPATPYCRAKAESEKVARRFQGDGGSVTIVYPGFVWGPRDPNHGEQHQTAANLLRGRIPFAPRGGLSMVDVRDVARILVATLETGRGPRRYFATGRHLSSRELIRHLGAATGRHLRIPIAPWRLVYAIGRAADLAQRVAKRRLPWNSEVSYIVGMDARCDDTRTREELGVVPMETSRTVADTVRSLLEDGRIEPKDAGTLAP
jgi:nucleoside-diphosphate-sugar epimerase